MGFLSKLFGKNDPADADFEYQGGRLSVDYSPSGMVLGGRCISLPADISEFTAILGRARNVKTKVGANYTWDKLGVYCYTKDGRTVHTFGVFIMQGEIELDTHPKSRYDGELTINGSDWFSQLATGVNAEVLAQLRLGPYNVTGEYASFGDTSRYSVVEFGIL